MFCKQSDEIRRYFCIREPGRVASERGGGVEGRGRGAGSFALAGHVFIQISMIHSVWVGWGGEGDITPCQRISGKVCSR